MLRGDTSILDMLGVYECPAMEVVIHEAVLLEGQSCFLGGEQATDAQPLAL